MSKSESSKKKIVENTKFGSTHTYSQEEKAAFVEFLNFTFDKDGDLSSIIPIDPKGTDLFSVTTNGVLFAKLILLINPNKTGFLFYLLFIYFLRIKKTVS
jgi:hypothetical protein